MTLLGIVERISANLRRLDIMLESCHLRRVVVGSGTSHIILQAARTLESIGTFVRLPVVLSVVRHITIGGDLVLDVLVVVLPRCHDLVHINRLVDLQLALVIDLRGLAPGSTEGIHVLIKVLHIDADLLLDFLLPVVFDVVCFDV